MSQPCNRPTETSFRGFLIALVARPPRPTLKVLRLLPIGGLNECVLFGDPGQNRLALTLDDGPHSHTTESILRVLAEHQARATFFVLGYRARNHPELLKAIAAGGHEIANHTWRDESSAALSPQRFAASLEDTHCEIARQLPEGRPVRLFRPGGGRPSAGTVFHAKAAFGYRCVLGSVYPHDVRVPFNSWIKRDVVRRAHPGGIIVMHEGYGRARVAELLDSVLAELTRRFEVTTVSDLLDSP